MYLYLSFDSATPTRKDNVQVDYTFLSLLLPDTLTSIITGVKKERCMLVSCQFNPSGHFNPLDQLEF